MPNPGVIRILLADDHAIMRQGLRALADRTDDLEVVAEAQDGREAVRLARETKPDVVIMDVVMTDTDGIDATRDIRASLPETRVVALSMHLDRRYVRGMLEAGATAYVLKDCVYEELASAVREVAAGRRYLSPDVLDELVGDYLDGDASRSDSDLDALTQRERQVLLLLAEGKSTKQAAAHLGVSVSTIETHRGHVMTKLGLANIAELTAFAMRRGLLGNSSSGFR